MNETEIQAKAAAPPKPYPEDSSLPTLWAVLGFAVLSILFEGWLPKAWVKPLAFFIAYGLVGLFILLKRPQAKLRWALIPCWLILSSGLYCLEQFPGRKLLIWASIIVLNVLSLVVVWRISKWNDVKKGERP